MCVCVCVYNIIGVPLYRGRGRPEANVVFTKRPQLPAAAVQAHTSEDEQQTHELRDAMTHCTIPALLAEVLSKRNVTGPLARAAVVEAKALLLQLRFCEGLKGCMSVGADGFRVIVLRRADAAEKTGFWHACATRLPDAQGTALRECAAAIQETWYLCFPHCASAEVQARVNNLIVVPESVLEFAWEEDCVRPARKTPRRARQLFQVGAAGGVTAGVHHRRPHVDKLVTIKWNSVSSSAFVNFQVVKLTGKQNEMFTLCVVHGGQATWPCAGVPASLAQLAPYCIDDYMNVTGAVTDVLTVGAALAPELLALNFPGLYTVNRPARGDPLKWLKNAETFNVCRPACPPPLHAATRAHASRA